jgi:hypothetical protein
MIWPKAALTQRSIRIALAMSSRKVDVADELLRGVVDGTATCACTTMCIDADSRPAVERT